MHERQTGTFIGRAGLIHIGTLILMEDVDNTQPVEIGYILSRNAWGKGYATEASMACLEWGFAHVDLENIVAKTNIANCASQNILKKIGMSYKKMSLLKIEGREGMYLFYITRGIL